MPLGLYLRSVESDKRTIKLGSFQITERIWVAAMLVLVCFGILYGLYGQLMLNPNSGLLSSEGEGARVHFVTAYHAQHDSSSLNFEGMNYPFGEHLVYCDAQPGIANGFRWAAQAFPSLADNAVGFQNFLSLYGFILAALLLYVVLLRWNVPAWYAALAALAITFIGPQVSRMAYQPGLAYPWVIPLLIWLYQRFMQSPTLKWTLLIALLNYGLFLINPYLGTMGTGLFGLAALGLWINQGWRKWKFVGFSGIFLALPGLAYYGWVAATDTRIDRVDIPLGFEQFRASFQTVFTSTASPLAGFYETLGMDAAHVNHLGEGWAYVGLSASLLLLTWLTLRLLQRFKSFPLPFKLNFEQQLLLIILTLFLLLAAALPFRLHESLEGLLDGFPPLRQLRAPGRMGWIFAIGINVLVFTLLYRVIERQAGMRKKGFIGIAIVLLGLTTYEGIELHRAATAKMILNNPFDREQLATNPEVSYLLEPLDALDFSGYKAIIPLPYFHVGSELFLPESHAPFRSQLEAMVLSYHTGIPLTGSHLSRISRSESMASLQFFSDELLSKDIEPLLQEGPFLITYMGKGAKLTAHEKRLIAQSKVVFENDFIHLYEFRPDASWYRGNRKLRQDFDQFRSNYTQEDHLFYFSRRLFQFEHRRYDHRTETKGLSGGGLQLPTGVDHPFWRSSEHTNMLPGIYNLSFWMECGDQRPQAQLVLVEIDQATGETKSIVLKDAKRSFDFFGGWLRWSTRIQLKPNVETYLYFTGPNHLKRVVVDELLIIPDEVSMYNEIQPGLYLWNNYPLFEPTDIGLTPTLGETR